MKINKLPRHVADLIAAGEVVERPGSVIKELMENSIDGGASAITVEIKNGGMSYIRVTDDGCGIAPEDAETAFLRHATSKISQEADLAAIGTLGFRGEALAAIASVSKIEMLTKAAGASEGVAISLEAGEVTVSSPAGCPEGTTMIVRDLFFNTPARMKFMKRDSAEASYCASVAAKLALAHPEISVKLIKDGAVQLHTPGDGKLMSAIYSVLGRETALGLIEASGAWDNVKTKGYVSAPSSTRGNRNYQHFFVNGRYIKSKLIQAAVEQAYKNRLMTGRYPACVLHVSLPETEVDVNVHPTKTEVKFVNERIVFESVYHTVLGALNKDGGRPEVSLGKNTTVESISHQGAKSDGFYKQMSAEQYKASAEKPNKTVDIPPTAANGRPLTTQQSEMTDQHQLHQPVAVMYNQPDTIIIPPELITEDIPKAPEKEAGFETSPQSVPESTALQDEISPKEVYYRVIGETMRTYIIVESDDGMVLIDKHAAHERIIFERLKASGQSIMSQSLLVPVVTDIAAQDKDIILENLELLNELGFEVSDFGGTSIAIRQIPADIDAGDTASVLLELAANLLDGRIVDPSGVRDEMLHTIACKAAVKAGSKNSTAELEALTREVMTNPDIKYCPHGRPVAVTISRHELEKQFKRI